MDVPILLPAIFFIWLYQLSFQEEPVALLEGSYCDMKPQGCEFESTYL